MKKGDKFYAVYVGPLRRSSDPMDVVVSGIGPKFVTVEFANGKRERFEKKTLHHNGKGYGRSYILYNSIQEIEEKREIEKRHIETRDYFISLRKGGLSLSQMKRIQAIINGEPESEKIDPFSHDRKFTIYRVKPLAFRQGI